MTFTSKLQAKPVCLRVTKPTPSVNLIVAGQGVTFFDASGPCALTFLDASGAPSLSVVFEVGRVVTEMNSTGQLFIDPQCTKGVVAQRGAYYWVSLDAQNRCIIAGIGEARMENKVYKYEFKAAQHGPDKKWLESLVAVRAVGSQITRILRDPITRYVPLIVKPTEELTMDEIAAGDVLPVAALSATQQQLYNTIAGSKFVLDGPDFPQFTQAIERSIRTPGLWCYERLKEKATEFNKDKPQPLETYLRITLGQNCGESPGIPYVMEIWPVGHYSPVHNHGGASAVIRVLNGKIDISLFPFLSQDAVAPFGTLRAFKGDVTWISPTLNQVHQLKNLETNKDTCITIQCYMYEEGDTKHYDYFDYVEAEKGIQQFEPDSDMDFLAFKETMRKEWAEQKAGRGWCGWPWQK
jgi:hypothetical protein